ncbi:MAG: tetratricopeptide repeat protein [Betaproteobacteria bacterium]|nr:tetratricopeptide repeat protein [Betaproteobacteria bacterium]
MNAKVVAAQRWEEIAAAPDEQIDLAEAALVIAAGEYGDLDIPAYIGKLDAMGAMLRRRLRQDISPSESIIALNRYVFEELGFSGNAADYYDPRNSFLNEVIDRRLGIPITLAVVYMEIGRRIGLPLHGVSFPGHFLVKCAVRDGAIVLDPYHKGASLGLDDLLDRLRAARNGLDPDSGMVRNMLASANNREILARMLRNLKGIYLQQQGLTKALAAVDRIIALDPRAAEEYRDRGRIYLDLECFRAALADFHRYLSLRPRAPDAEAIDVKIGELEQLAARLN